MFNLKVGTLIEAPIKRVFDYMSTPENDFQWQYGTLATATITNRYNGKGVYFRSAGHLLGRRNLGTYEVIESNSNLKYRFKSITGPSIRKPLTLLRRLAMTQRLIYQCG